MPVQLKLPDLGEGVHEGEILRWLVQAGDVVQEDQSLVEVMTDKVTAEIPSPYEGTVLELLAPAGAVVPVGTPLISIEETNGEAPLVRDGETARRRDGDEEEIEASEHASSSPSRRLVVSASRSNGASRVRAVPFVRKLARDLGVDLAAIVGTGPSGRITEADVRAVATNDERPTTNDQRPTTTVGSDRSDGSVRADTGRPEPRVASASEPIPFRGLRRRIAERMVAAQRTAACVTYVDECDMTELVALRESSRDLVAAEGVKLTYLPFVLKATAAALRQHPRLNATIDEERGEILLLKEYHLGIACETPEGLLVPVIRDVNRKSVLDLAREVAEKAERARAGRAEREELQGSTFTISSMGALGGLFATPILNPPEVAILGVHRIQKRPVCRGDAIVARDVAHLSLTFDHRALDGADAARFVTTVIRYLEEPNLLLLS